MNTLPANIEEVTAVINSGNQSLIAAASKAVIENEEQLSVGVDILSEIKQRVKGVEAERAALVKPLNEHVKLINAKFKTVTEPLEEAAHILSNKVLARQRVIQAEKSRIAEEQRKQKEEELLAAAAKKEAIGDTEKAEQLLDYASKVKAREISTGHGTFTEAKSGITKRWTFEIVDLAATGKDGSQYLMLDSSKVREAIRQGVREIPGLRIFQEESLSVRA